MTDESLNREWYIALLENIKLWGNKWLIELFVLDWNRLSVWKMSSGSFEMLTTKPV